MEAIGGNTKELDKNKGYEWVRTHIHSDLTEGAVFAGFDTEGASIYVARAYDSDQLLPALYVPDKNEAFVLLGSDKLEVYFIEVLVGTNLGWLPCSGKNIPETAVLVSGISNDKPIYFGRGNWKGETIIGKVCPNQECLYVMYNGQEQCLESYEVLVYGEKYKHKEMPSIPSNAFLAGHDYDGSPIYVGRTFHGGDMLPAKVVPSKNKAFVAFSCKEHVKYNVEVLTASGSLRWVSAGNGYVPSTALKSGKTSNGEHLYIGRGYYHGSLTPGKVHPSHGCLYIPYGGSEHSITEYEVLCNNY